MGRKKNQPMTLSGLPGIHLLIGPGTLTSQGQDRLDLLRYGPWHSDKERRWCVNRVGRYLKASRSREQSQTASSNEGVVLETISSSLLVVFLRSGYSRFPTLLRTLTP